MRGTLKQVIFEGVKQIGPEGMAALLHGAYQRMESRQSGMEIFCQLSDLEQALLVGAGVQMLHDIVEALDDPSSSQAAKN